MTETSPLPDAATPPVLPEGSPFAAPWDLDLGLPDFTGVRHEDIAPAVHAGMAAQRAQWEAVAAEAAERYPFGPFQAARKLERLCLCAMTMEEPAVAAVERYQGNLLYVARLAGLSGSLPSLAGGFGLFFEAALPSLEALPPLLPPKAQTLVCGGLEPSETAALLARAGARGVDRVVPLGQALEMDTVWDGRDLIAALSRIIG